MTRARSLSCDHVLVNRDHEHVNHPDVGFSRPKRRAEASSRNSRPECGADGRLAAHDKLGNFIYLDETGQHIPRPNVIKPAELGS